MAFDAFAQAPEQFSYQAVIRDAQGDLVSNQSVTVNISILEEIVQGRLYLKKNIRLQPMTMV